VQKKLVTIYWLIPAEPERELFRKIIRILAEEFDAPRFEPHLSLLATPLPKDRQATRRILERVKARPIRLKIRDISFSTIFTKTLFVRFKSSATLEKLIVDLARAAKSRVNSRPEPHVSLLYKKMKASLKKELASAINLPFREVSFDSIRAMRCVSPTATRADVERWRKITERRLKS
jgi:cyclic phosphodiesterase-like protein